MPSNDLSDARWRKSVRSGETGDNCVEIAPVDEQVAVRDSQCPDGPVVMLARDTWRRLVGDLKSL
jgi:hypothetical protein